MDEKKIMKLLNSSDSDDRREGIYAIADQLGGDLSSDSVILKKVVELLEDKVKGVRDAALNFLIDHQYEEILPQVVKLLASDRIEVRNLATELLFSYGELSLPYLYVALGSNDHDVRKFAVDVIGLIGSAESVPRIIELIDDEDPNVRFSVIEALGNIGCKDCATFLKEAYGKYEDIRPVLLETIGKLKLTDLHPLIVQSLDSAEPMERFAAIEALGIIGSKNDLPRLEKIANELDEFFLTDLFKAMIRISIREDVKIDLPFQKEEYVLKLIELLKDHDYHVREFIARNLHRIIDCLSMKNWLLFYRRIDDELKYEFLNYLKGKNQRDLKVFITDAFLQSDMNGKNQILDQAVEFINRRVLIESLNSDDEWLNFRIIELLTPEEIEGMLEQLVDWAASYNEIRQLSARTAFNKLGIEKYEDLILYLKEHNIELSQESKERIGGLYNDHI